MKKVLVICLLMIGLATVCSASMNLKEAMEAFGKSYQEEAKKGTVDFESQLAQVKENLKKYFNVDQLPGNPDHVENISVEKFSEYTSAGIPVVVQDCLPRWPAVNWTCDSLREKYANETVEAWGDYNGKKEKLKFKLGESFLDRILPLDQTDEKSPNVISWYWYPIEGEEPSKNNETALAKSLLADYSLPYFMEPSVENLHIMRNRLEMFFGTKGSGAAAHADEVCEYIFSAQVCGSKRWRFGLMSDTELMHMKRVAENNGTEVNYDSEFEDNLTNEAITGKDGGELIFDFTMNAGDVVFFPPGMVHETKGVSDGCALSFSLQFNDPPPVKYLKAFKKRLLWGPSKHCFVEYWNTWMFGDPTPRSDGTARSNRMEAMSLFMAIDRNEDEQLDQEELLAYFKTIKNRRGDLKTQHEVERDVRNFMMFQDEQGKGYVTLKDLLKSWKAWGSRDVQVVQEVSRQDQSGSSGSSSGYDDEEQAQEGEVDRRVREAPVVFGDDDSEDDTPKPSLDDLDWQSFLAEEVAPIAREAAQKDEL